MAFGDDDLLSMPFRTVIYAIAGLPMSALVICILVSITLHWDEATRTHCGVTNWLPSVSAAVASYAPERYIWRLLIGIHGAPRLALAFASSLFSLACSVACALNVFEVLFLLLLTSISSIEDYFLHKMCFIGFIVCGLSYMMFSTWLFDYSGRRRTTTLCERSFQYKVLCCVGLSVSLVCAMYFFYRHNAYCEPGVYTLFALCEYAVIVMNILFHSTIYYDFHARSVVITSAGATFHYDALPLHNYSEKKT
ncbi:post-GPI attachment to protein factor 2 [Aphelenchoides avenae]|nr:post-GPI attachment to protein factor 2 [Aphelenchus avenae]